MRTIFYNKTQNKIVEDISNLKTVDNIIEEQAFALSDIIEQIQINEVTEYYTLIDNTLTKQTK